MTPGLPQNEQWTNFQERFGTHPFSHPAWCRAWTARYRPRAVHVLGASSTGETPRLLAPFAAHDRAARSWITLGAPLVDFGTPLGPRDHAGDLPKLLAEHSGSWSTVRLCGIDPSVAELLTADVGAGIEFHRLGAEDTPRIPITSYDDWLGRLRPGRRRAIGTTLRQLERIGSHSFDVVDAPGEIGRAVREFESLRLQSWWARGRDHELLPDIRTQRHSHFLHDAVVTMAATGDSSVVRLQLAGRLVASAVVLWTPATALLALTATDTRLGPNISAGLAIVAWTVRLVNERDRSVLELGRGDEPYKFALGAEARVVDHLLAAPAGTMAWRWREAARQRWSLARYRLRTRERQ